MLSDNINFRTLTIVTDVLDSLNFTDVAKSHGITQPAVSLQVSKFEELVGVDLIKRVGNRMILTEPGRHALQLGTSILRLLEELEHIRSVSSDEANAIATAPDLAFMLQRNGAAFPGLLQGRYVIVDSSANVKRRFEAREFPLAIRFLFDYERNIPKAATLSFVWACASGQDAPRADEVVQVDLPDPAGPIGQAAIAYLNERGIRFKVMRELAEGIYPAIGTAGGEMPCCLPVPMFSLGELGLSRVTHPAMQDPILVPAGFFNAEADASAQSLNASDLFSDAIA